MDGVTHTLRRKGLSKASAYHAPRRSLLKLCTGKPDSNLKISSFKFFADRTGPHAAYLMSNLVQRRIEKESKASE